jgi:hypothetical protein
MEELKLKPNINNSNNNSQSKKKKIKIHIDASDSTTKKMIDELENGESTHFQPIKFPDPPSMVYAHGLDETCYIWWEYSDSARINQWEIKRYRCDRAGEWNLKGSSTIADKKPRKVCTTIC